MCARSLGRSRVGADWLGDVLLDELMPAPGGVIHVIALTGGCLRMVARDLVATWA